MSTLLVFFLFSMTFLLESLHLILYLYLSVAYIAPSHPIPSTVYSRSNARYTRPFSPTNFSFLLNSNISSCCFHLYYL